MRVPQRVWDGAKDFHWRQRWWKRISATELSREVSITCRNLDLGLPKKAKAVVGTLWSVSPKIYHDLCSSTWLFASFLKTHSCSFLLAFLYRYDHHSMSITILTNKTLRDNVLLFDLVSSILCAASGQSTIALCTALLVFVPCPRSLPLGFAIAIYWNWFVTTMRLFGLSFKQHSCKVSCSDL